MLGCVLYENLTSDSVFPSLSLVHCCTAASTVSQLISLLTYLAVHEKHHNNLLTKRLHFRMFNLSDIQKLKHSLYNQYNCKSSHFSSCNHKRNPTVCLISVCESIEYQKSLRLKMPPLSNHPHYSVCKAFFYLFLSCQCGTAFYARTTIYRSSGHPPGGLFSLMNLCLCPHKQPESPLSKQRSQCSLTGQFGQTTLTEPKEQNKGSDHHRRRRMGT